MSTEQTNLEEGPPKKSKMPLIIGLVLALTGGGGGFYATWSGMILGGNHGGHQTTEVEEIKDPFGDIAFVEIDPMTISVNAQPERRMLRFRAQLSFFLESLTSSTATSAHLRSVILKIKPL